jgi:hypothetical protein
MVMPKDSHGAPDAIATYISFREFALSEGEAGGKDGINLYLWRRKLIALDEVTANPMCVAI